MDLLHELGGKVRHARTRRALSLRALATKSGVSVRFLCELEAGRGNISVLKLVQVAGALGTTAGVLLGAAEAAGDGAGRRRVIALLGLRGAGKSTVGGRLASRLKLPFFELDGLIEAQAGLSLSEIFAVHGEDWYRRLELEVLRRFLIERAEGVLATGGGIVTHPEAFELLQEEATTVWLRAPPDDHWDRVVGQGDVRPMAENPGARAELRRLLDAREPLYGKALHQLDTSQLGVKGTVDALVKTLAAGAGSRQ